MSSKNMNLLLAPHSDDEALFASYIIMREKPRVIIVTDGTSHAKKFGISIEDRRNESREAMAKLGVKVDFLGIAEEDLDNNSLALELYKLNHNYERVFVPALQGGHPHHDIVCSVAEKIFKPEQLLFYSTYQKDNLIPVGELEMKPSIQESALKDEILHLYPSQHKINKHHFEAVIGQSEYLNLKPESWRRYA